MFRGILRTCLPRLAAAVLVPMLTGVLPGLPALAAGPDGAWAQWYLAGTGPAALDGAAVTFDSRRGRALYLGGGEIVFYHASHLLLNLTTWSVDVRGSGTSATVSQSFNAWPMVLQRGAIAYDSLADVAWAFGGAQQNESTGQYDQYADALWRLDLSATAPAWQGVDVPGLRPARRWGHSLVFDAQHRRLLVYGGRGADGHVLGDAWSISVDTPTVWTALMPAGAPPPARDRHAAILDPVRGRMVIVGGLDDASSPLADVWALDLGGSSAWSNIAATGMFPGGGAPAVYDPRDDRVLVLGSTAPPATMLVFELALGPQPAWRALNAAGYPPVARPFFTAVFDPLTHEITSLDSDRAQSIPYFMVPSCVPHSLHLDPLPVVDLTATLTTRFSRGYTTLDWIVTTADQPYSNSSVERMDPGGPVSIGGLRWGSGPVSVVDSQPVAGRHYDYRVTWFDGSVTRYTPLFGVDTPPAPVVLDITPLDATVSGDQLTVTFAVPNDSAAYLAPLGVERQVGGGAWVRLAAVWPLAGLVTYTTSDFPPDASVQFRLAWGPTLIEHASPDTGVVTPPVVTLVGAAANYAGAVVDWAYKPGLPLTSIAYRIRYYGNPSSGWEAVDTLVADSRGVLHFEDVDVTARGFGQYHLGWDVNGTMRFTPDVAVAMWYGDADLLHLISADSTGVILTWDYPDGVTTIPLVLERERGTVWDSIATLVTAPGEARRYVDHVPAPDLVRYRMRWPQRGGTLHSLPVTAEVQAGGPVPSSLSFLPIAPNPATDAIVMSIAIPDATPAKLDVFDMSGRHVGSTTVTGPGWKTARVPTTGLAPGVYLVRASHPTASSTRRVIVVK